MDLLYRLKSLLDSTGFEVIDKNRIQFIYPAFKDYVDLMLICPEYNICIKDFWTFNTINQNTLQTYINGSKEFNTNTYTNIYPNKKMYFIILKKNTEKKPNQNYNVNDYKSVNSDYLYLIEKNSLDKLINHFSHLMYANKIYFYEPDGCTIMLDLV